MVRATSAADISSRPDAASPTAPIRDPDLLLRLSGRIVKGCRLLGSVAFAAHPDENDRRSHEGARVPEHGLWQWTTAHRGGLAIFVGYLVAAVVVTLGAWRGPASGWAGTCCDQEPAIWYLGWTPHALAHGLDPFFTTQIGSPAGVNLMW